MWNMRASILAPILFNAIIVFTALIHLRLMTYRFSFDVLKTWSEKTADGFSQGWLSASLDVIRVLKKNKNKNNFIGCEYWNVCPGEHLFRGLILLCQVNIYFAKTFFIAMFCWFSGIVTYSQSPVSKIPSKWHVKLPLTLLGPVVQSEFKDWFNWTVTGSWTLPETHCCQIEVSDLNQVQMLNHYCTIGP